MTRRPPPLSFLRDQARLRTVFSRVPRPRLATSNLTCQHDSCAEQRRASQITGKRGPIEPRSATMKQPLIGTAKTLFASALYCAVTSAALAQSAQEFVNKVAISDLFEIQSSQLAISKNADADTKPFAEKMVSDHQKTSTELKALVDSGKLKVTLPTSLDTEHQKMLDDLKAKNGNEFDRSYDQTQLKAHQDAVALFEAYSKTGDNPELKSWAATTLPHLKEHLSMAQKLK